MRARNIVQRTCALGALALLCVLTAVLGGAPRLAFAASVSVTATPQPDGSVVATATGSFASCVVCNAWDADGHCTESRMVNKGDMLLRRDSSLTLCGASGSGTVSCTSREDRGRLHGTHEYRVAAWD